MPLYQPGASLRTRLALAHAVLLGRYHVETHVSDEHHEQTHLLTPRISHDPMPMRIGDYDFEFTLIGAHLDRIERRLEEFRQDRERAQQLGNTTRVDELSKTITTTYRQLKRAELEYVEEYGEPAEISR